MDYLAGLNQAQRKAVEYENGPLLVVAGAGAGKTKTITARIARLIERGVPPEAILAVTFTNKAAAEMAERLQTRLAETRLATRPVVATFHGLSAMILRESGRAVGVSRHFSILDREESLSAIKEAMRVIGLTKNELEPRKALAAISSQKNRLLGPNEYEESLANQSLPYQRRLLAVWRRYEALLQARAGLDFDDLIGKTVSLLRREEAVRNSYQERWQYIHIDEYQDTNEAQYELAKILAAKHENICVVGDIDQSIYSWRGADYRNILKFEEDYHQVMVVTLEENYRSTQTILDLANRVIRQNKKRKEKNLFTKNEAGEDIGLIVGLDEADEANLIVQAISEQVSKGMRPADVAILYRTNFQSRALEESLLKAGLPYQVLGVRFYERKEVKDVLAYLKLALNPADVESLKRVANAPPRGLGKVSVAKIAVGQAGQLTSRAARAWQTIQNTLTAIQAATSRERPSGIIKLIMNQSGLEAELKNGNEEDQERLGNLRELVTLATKYDNLSPAGEGLARLLADAALASEQDSLDARTAKERPGVKLMTVHAAKGLEFDQVFITGLEDGLFPHAPRLGDDEERDGEEERRLFYVAVTRAKKRLCLSYAESRTIFGNRQMNAPSPFLFELQAESLSLPSTPKTGYIDF